MPTHPSVDTLTARARAEKKYRPVAVGVILRGDGKVLLVASAKNLANWGFPQGGIEEGEGAEAALLREIHEEVGITPDKLTIKRMLGWSDIDAEESRKGERGFANGKRYFFYEVTYTGQSDLEINTAEIALNSWMNLSEAETLLKRTRKVKRNITLWMIRAAHRK